MTPRPCLACREPSTVLTAAGAYLCDRCADDAEDARRVSRLWHLAREGRL